MTPRTSVGRRVATRSEIELPGDYCGPVPISVKGETIQACFFLLPIARDDEALPEARSLHQVWFPPHTYRECADGSLEIRASIGAGPGGEEGYHWHGFLDEGHLWREI